MLLSDRDLHALLPHLAFETDEPRRPFVPADQIQPCSIDLRLDRCFWLPAKPYGRGKVDFRNPAQGQINMQRLFRRRWLRMGEGITLKPGQMILGRTFEQFTIPNGYAGKLEGRSTFARLGLSIHCTGDFINPGWRGRMPLQLVNHGVAPLILTPYLPVCQLLLLRTTSESDKPYGTDVVGHKYMNDEGEPSRYWQDARIRRLQEACGRVPLPERVQRAFIEFIGSRGSEIVDRFLAFLNSLPSTEITNPREVLEQFADQDTRRAVWKRRALLFCKWFSFLPVGVALGSLLKQPYELAHFIFWGVSLSLLPLGFWANFFAREPDAPFTVRDVEEHFTTRE